MREVNTGRVSGLATRLEFSVGHFWLRFNARVSTASMSTRLASGSLTPPPQPLPHQPIPPQLLKLQFNYLFQELIRLGRPIANEIGQLLRVLGANQNLFSAV